MPCCCHSCCRCCDFCNCYNCYYYCLLFFTDAVAAPASYFFKSCRFSATERRFLCFFSIALELDALALKPELDDLLWKNFEMLLLLFSHVLGLLEIHRSHYYLNQNSWFSLSSKDLCISLKDQVIIWKHWSLEKYT